MNIRITEGDFSALVGEAELDVFQPGDGPCREDALDLDLPLLKARVVRYGNHEFCVCEQSYAARRPLEISSSGHPVLTLGIAMEGGFVYRYGGMAKESRWEPGTLNFWAGEDPGYCRFAEGQRSTMLGVAISEACLHRLASSSEGLEILLRPFLAGGGGALLPANVPADPRIVRVVASLRDSSLLGAGAGLFCDAKLLELFALLASLSGLDPARQDGARLRPYDEERLREARDILLRRFLDPPSIPELARLAGINECKLKKGFRELFGASVYGLLFEHRMELARGYLLDTAKSVQEIAALCGYEHVSHFSTAFRRGNGLSPMAFRSGKGGASTRPCLAGR